MGEQPDQGSYKVACGRFEPSTLRLQGIEHTASQLHISVHFKKMTIQTQTVDPSHTHDAYPDPYDPQDAKSDLICLLCLYAIQYSS